MHINPIGSSLISSQLTPKQQVELPVKLGQDGQSLVVTPDTTKAVTALKEASEQEKPRGNKDDEKAFSASDLAEAIKKLNEAVKLYKGDLQFVTDDDTQLQVVKVVDRGTNELIRQIPSPEAIRIAKAIDEFSSILLKEEA